ncbi:MAG: TonB-dependent receptor [bacterium]
MTIRREALHRGVLQVLLAGSVFLCLLPRPAPGQAGAGSEEGGDPFAGVEQFVVTGSSTVEALTESTMSVTSFDAADLDAYGVSDVSDVAQFTPNLSIVTASSTTPTFFIRGVGLNDFTANAAGAVAIYVDGAPRNLPAIQLPLLFDLEGVNVEKGPQGSGPNLNASAGAIRIVTRKPSGDRSAYARFDYGNYDLIDAEGAVEVPIIEDVLAIRSAFRLRRRDGLMTNRCGGLTQDEIDALRPSEACDGRTSQVTPGLETDLNDRDVWAARSTLRYLPPVEEMEWLFTVHGERTDQLGNVGQPIGTRGFFGGADGSGFRYQAPEIGAEFDTLFDEALAAVTTRFPDLSRREARQLARPIAQQRLSQSLASRPLDRFPFEGDFNTPGYERQTTLGARLQGEWLVGALQIQSITSFIRYDRETLIDADFSPAEFFEFASEDDAWQVTQDLRVSGELESAPIRWSTGGFYLQEQLDFDLATLNAVPGVDPLFQAYEQETFALGLFADVSWDFLDDFTLDAGFRYNWQQKTFDAEIFLGANRSSDQCRERVGGIPPCKRTVTVDHPTGLIQLEYRFDELRSAYVKYNHGWKGVQFSPRDGRRAQEVTDVADPEVIDAFEVGFEGSWLDARLKMNAAFFWYSYQNYQVFTFTNDVGVPPSRIVINASDAQLYGAELETTLEPIDRLTLEIRSSWIESRFLDFTASGARVIPGSNPPQTFRQVLDFNGNPLPNAPRFKVSATLQYDLDLGRFGSFVPRYDVVWTDEVAFDPSDGRGAPNAGGEIFMPKNAIGQGAFWLHNLRVTYRAPGARLEIAGWVRNLTNEVYKTLAFDASSGPQLVGNLLGEPRTYGLSARLTY